MGFRFFKEWNKEMPSVERKAEIKQVVDALVSKNSELQFPGFDIVKYLKAQDFSVASNVLDSDTTGMLFVDDENFVPDTETHRLIVVNSLLQEQANFIQRRRFIVAHEYAHFVLHKNKSRQYAHRDTSKREKAEEKEADYFARCLLMPEDWVRAFLNLLQPDGTTWENKVSLVSRVFNVTKKKAEQRLKEDLCCE